jgi:hypothetical protein
MSLQFAIFFAAGPGIRQNRRTKRRLTSLTPNESIGDPQRSGLR